MGEHIHQQYILQRFNLQSIQRSNTSQHQEDNLILKMGKGPELTLLQGGHREGL